jgi:hypothetical protein
VKARGFFQLVRIPTVFSALSNAFAGYWIGGGRAGIVPLLLGMLASGLYLMAGMALNDIADLKVDRAERPSRPLPSGAISLPIAWTLSLAMMVLGLLCQWRANPVSAVVGFALILAIFLYNFLLKKTFLGPAAMGLCRLLNLLGGIALNADGTSDLLFLPFNAEWALLSLWLYIALVTFLARDEVRGNTGRRVRVFFAGLAIWCGLWMGFALIHPSLISALLLAVLLFHLRMLHGALTNLWKEPTVPSSTGRTVGALLRNLPLTDVIGMLAAGVAWPWAMLGAAFMLPGPFLAKRFYST